MPTAETTHEMILLDAQQNNRDGESRQNVIALLEPGEELTIAWDKRSCGEDTALYACSRYGVAGRIGKAFITKYVDRLHRDAFLTAVFLGAARDEDGILQARIELTLHGIGEDERRSVAPTLDPETYDLLRKQEAAPAAQASFRPGGPARLAPSEAYAAEKRHNSNFYAIDITPQFMDPDAAGGKKKRRSNRSANSMLIVIALMVLFGIAISSLSRAYNTKQQDDGAPTLASYGIHVDPASIEAIRMEGRGAGTASAVPAVDWWYRCAVTHDGSGPFSVSCGEELGIEGDGAFAGAFLAPAARAGETLEFTVAADGAWTLELQPLGLAADSNASGSGAQVGNLFLAPGPGTYALTHAGKGEFIVACLAGDALLQVARGAGEYDSKRHAALPSGSLAAWVVVADGEWTITRAE